MFLWQDLQILIEIDFSPNARCVIRNPDHLDRLYLLDLVPEDAGDEDSIRGRNRIWTKNNDLKFQIYPIFGRPEAFFGSILFAH